MAPLGAGLQLAGSGWLAGWLARLPWRATADVDAPDRAPRAVRAVHHITVQRCSAPGPDLTGQDTNPRASSTSRIHPWMIPPATTDWAGLAGLGWASGPLQERCPKWTGRRLWESAPFHGSA